MDQVPGQPLGDWLPKRTTRLDEAADRASPRHVTPSALVRRTAAWPISDGVLASLQRSAALSRNAAWGYAYGQPDRLIEIARQAVVRDRRYLAPGGAIERSLNEVLDGDLSDAARRSVIATLAQHLPNTLDRSLPRSILELYPRAVGVLAGFLESGGAYDEDMFAKDLRFVAGASAPAGAQYIDVLFASSLRADLNRLRHVVGMTGRLVLAGDPRRAAGLLAEGRMGDWLQIHTDTRDIADFNPQGWARCYHRIADLLALRPSLAGMLGISWFYDPGLREISPRLSYLQDEPLQNGAFLVRLKPTPLDAERAGAASPTRRRLIESGAYTPTSYALFWPRRALLRWARQVQFAPAAAPALRMSDVA